MKLISAELKAHLALETTTLAYLIKLTRVDSTILGFTTHDKNIIYDGVTYQTKNSFTASTLESHNDLSTDNMSVVGILSSDAISSEDILLGKYDNAQVDVYLCNWADLTMGVLQLRHGWLGEVTVSNNQYSAEILGMHDKLQRTVGNYYVVDCRHNLGDTLCGVNLTSYTTTGVVSSTTDKANFIDTVTSTLINGTTGNYNYGKLTWLTGDNAALSMEVKTFQVSAGTSATFELWLPMPYDIVAGDTFEVIAGCDKVFSTCQTKFSNYLNFGGFPYIPGIHSLLYYP